MKRSPFLKIGIYSMYESTLNSAAQQHIPTTSMFEYPPGLFFAILDDSCKWTFIKIMKHKSLLCFKIDIIQIYTSVPSKAVCGEIGPALWKIGSTGIVRMSKKDAFSLLFSQFSAKANDFGTRSPSILSNLVELAQAQNP